MNSKPISETDALRSDIEMTRRRMDDTVEALGERLRGRHLVDEVIGYFRGGEDGSGTGGRLREKISESAGAAANTVVNTVKKNPLPVLLIAAGAAWLAYTSTRGPRAEVEEDLEDEDDNYDPDTHYDRPLEYPDSDPTLGATAEYMADEGGSKLDRLKDKASAAKDQVKEKLSDLGDSARTKLHSAKERASEIGSRVRDRAGEIGSQVQQRTREVYAKTRDQVSRTTNEHPLEVGLGCLALGVLVGLALPTPAPVNRMAGPAVDRLRSRTRDAGREVLQKGKRVVQAASHAAKEEAQSQGLSIDRLRDGGEAVADAAQSAAKETAQREGLPGIGSSESPALPVSNDPSAARPGM